MLTKTQKRVIGLAVLSGLCFLFMIIGLAMIGGRVEIVFYMASETEMKTYEGEHVPERTRASIAGVKLPTPIRVGYKFEGWTTAPYLKSSIETYEGKYITRVRNKKETLFARWTEIEPIASLYVHGEWLKDIRVPKRADQALYNGSLGQQFLIDKNLRDETGKSLWDMPILKAYPIDNRAFVGWAYRDRNGNDIQLEYDFESTYWRKVKILSDGTRDETGIGGEPISADNPFAPNCNIALTAVFQTSERVNLKYILPEASQSGSDVFTSPSNAIYRFGEEFQLPLNLSRPITGQTLVGWALNLGGGAYDGGDIYMPGSSFYLNPALVKNLTKANNSYEITFFAVTTPTQTITSSFGTYEKTISPSGIVTLSRPIQSGSKIQINDFDPFESTTVRFDFRGDGKVQLRDSSKTDVDMQKQGFYENVAAANSAKVVSVTRRTANSPMTIALPVANNYAVAGHMFLGWRTKCEGATNPADNSRPILDDKLYAGGMTYYLPRGARQISFTAVWADSRSMLLFDCGGAIQNWSDSAYFVRPNSHVRLPDMTGRRYGYVFSGWKSMRGDVFAGGTDVILEPQLCILRAVWTPKPVSIELFVDSYGNPYIPLSNGTANGTTDKYKFGDIVTLKRFDSVGSGTHLGWKFPEGQTPKFIFYNFGDNRSYYSNENSDTSIPFVRTVRFVIDEKFAKRHSGVSDEAKFFERTIVGVPNLDS